MSDLWSLWRPRCQRGPRGREHGHGHVVSAFILLTTVYLCLFAALILTVYLNTCDSLNMSAAVRSRTAARGWVTRAGNAIRDLFNQPVDYFALQTACDEFDMRLNALDNAQSMVELEIAEDLLDGDIEAAANFRNTSQKPRSMAARLLHNQQLQDGSVDGGASIRDSVAAVSAKLPKIQLPHFSGDVKQWTSFWEQFEVVIYESELPDITKFTYLRSLLKGEAKLSVQVLALTNANYTVAIDILKKRFGRTDRIVFSHIEELLNISVPKQPRVSVLWELNDKLQAHVRSLEALGITGEQYGVLLCPVIISRLPPDLRLEWTRESENHEGDLEWLLEFLQNEISRRERSQSVIKQESHSAVSVNEIKGGPRQATTAALPSLSLVPEACTPCSRRGHTVNKCYDLTKVPVSERKAVLKSHNLCFRCLSNSKGHNFRRCTVKCSSCKGNHHALLCDKGGVNTSSQSVSQDVPTPNTTQSPNQSPAPNAYTATNMPTNAGVSHVGVTQSTVSSNAQVLLQIVRVPVRGAKGVSDAIVLFETGADRTYVTESLVDRIGPEWVGTRTMSCTAFGCNSPGEATVRNVYDFCLQGVDHSLHVQAAEVPSICAALQRPSVPDSVLSSLGEGLHFVEAVEGEVKVDILVGQDFLLETDDP